MDQQNLVGILQGSIHPDTREEAEKQLSEVSVGPALTTTWLVMLVFNTRGCQYCASTLVSMLAVMMPAASTSGMDIFWPKSTVYFLVLGVCNRLHVGLPQLKLLLTMLTGP